MRRHGWELPYHPLQVVAIAVFLALAFSFHVFFVPFVGSRIMELIGISIYTPLMISVFGLYIWCAASNPADPAILQSKKSLAASPSATLTSTAATSTRVLRREKNESSTEPSSLAQTSSAHSNTEHRGGDRHAQEASSFHSSSFVCENFPKSACCVESMCGPRVSRGHSEEDKLYCSLCEVEIYKWSKHCRVCDKCIDGFDHHCRWLNNCIGRKNYSIFIALMISGVCLLVLQWAVGVWVIARCFLTRQQFQEEISTRLGSSFSIVPFLSVVAISTVLAAFATLPLGQLCVFHALLIQKGISTYDYIVAMRERDQHLEMEEGFQSPYMSPASSVATAMSGASSAGALHHAAWCTPPHLFIDQEQDPIKVGLEALKRTSVDKITGKKPPAKINPWALAKLNTEDALRAAAEARKSSSVLRPIVNRLPPAVVIAETDSSDECSSGGGGAVASSQPRQDAKMHSKPVLPNSPQFEAQPVRHGGNVPKVRVMLGGDSRGYLEHSRERGFLDPSKEKGHVLTPLQLEARNAFCGRGGVLEERVSSSTESSEGLSANPTTDLPSAHRQSHSCYRHTSQSLPLPVPRSLHHRVDGGIGCSGFHHNNDNNEIDDNTEVFSAAPRLTSTTCTSDGYEASGGESAEDDSDHVQDQRDDSAMVGQVAFMERYHPSQKVGHSRPQFRTSPNLPRRM